MHLRNKRWYDGFEKIWKDWKDTWFFKKIWEGFERKLKRDLENVWIFENWGWMMKVWNMFMQKSMNQNMKIWKNLKLETKSPPPAFLAFNAQLLAIMGV